MSQVGKVLIFVLLSMPLRLDAAQEYRSEYRYVVTGRVVDDQGKPVPKAWVVLLTAAEAKTGGSMIPYHATNADGKFRVEEESAIGSTERILYVITAWPPNAYAPIDPPFNPLGTTDSLFAGRHIFINKNQEIDLGEVPLQVRYALILIRLRKQSGTPLFNEPTAELPDIWVRVRDGRGDIISIGSVPAKAFTKADSSIALALPEGKWQIEMALDPRDMVWNALPSLVISEASTRPKQMTLELSDRPGTAPDVTTTTYDPVTARKELEKIGISYGENAFIECARGGNTHALRLFLAAGMDPNTKGEYGETALMYAASLEMTDVVKLLLDKGANVNAKDNQGATALMRAAGSFSSSIVRTLLSNGADVNAKMNDGKTALFIAAGNARANNVRILIDASADLNAKDKQGKTALMLANELDHSDIVQILKQAGARP